MSEELKAPQMFTIGALSRATGVPPDTLRTWERRYGFPKPERTDTGHRRYSQATLERLRLVREALQLGHRAATVIHTEFATLRDLVEQARGTEAVQGEQLLNLRIIDRWLDLVRRFDGRTLDRELRGSIAALGVPSFLAMRAAPFIQALGDRWADGLLGVRHEHFASERLSEFFIRQWRPLSDACSGPAVICATPAGERHALGLQMAAFTLALNNLRVVYLGADLPANEVVEAVMQHSARAVVLSAALGIDADRLTLECGALRMALGPDFPVLAGGAGFLGISVVTRLEDFQSLERWAQTFSAALV
jgi:MerR family transcriptional regulator, light-induced transcriptional regulator